ncbi:MAG: Gfo/Idh/MocA family protein [Mucilaginibacter sp.]|uniref:Gfo/Idh/MocA family protein n=1 Tax=Mucilaginibacter sp. TaxID=1882438 RepID=UPI0034E51BC3
MIKIGIIGLGDIATKAYLPVLSSKAGFDFHLCSRNENRLQQLGNQYRISNLHTNLASLVTSGIQAAFVHAATEAHFNIVKQLLEANVAVFVDKPLTMDYHLSKELVELAEARNVLLMVGFNRRYAPVYQQLKLEEPMLVLMQKNRKSLPDFTRRFVVEDFIHVVDTLRYLFPYPIQDLLVHGIKKGGLLHQLVVQFVAENGAVAIGIMNRDTATTEEKVEVMTAKHKRVVYNVSDLVIEENRNSIRTATNDWEPTLHKRGFKQMVDDFLQAVVHKTSTQISARDALFTHEICERIVEDLEADL